MTIECQTSHSPACVRLLILMASLELAVDYVTRY